MGAGEGFAARLTGRDLDDLRELGARRRLPAGALLFLEGDEPHDVMLVETGDVRVACTNADGGEVVLDVVGPGELLGELSAIDGHPRSATAVALTSLELTTIANARFVAFLEERPRLLRALLETTVGRLRTANRRQLEYGTADALGRLCGRLLELGDRYGVDDGAAIVVKAPLTQTELARWCGLSREAVVKSLRSLRTLGWITNDGTTITILRREDLASRSRT